MTDRLIYDTNHYNELVEVRFLRVPHFEEQQGAVCGEGNTAEGYVSALKGRILGRRRICAGLSLSRGILGEIFFCSQWSAAMCRIRPDRL